MPIALSDFCGLPKATGAARSIISHEPTNSGAAKTEAGVAAKSLTEATRSKLLHDAAQFRFLAERRRDRQRFEALARNYEEVAKDVPEEAAPLSDEQLDRLGEDYNTAIDICGAPELAGPAVSERPDRDALMRRFREQQAGAVWFDDLLTPPALARTETVSA